MGLVPALVSLPFAPLLAGNIHEVQINSKIDTCHALLGDPSAPRGRLWNRKPSLAPLGGSYCKHTPQR